MAKKGGRMVVNKNKAIYLQAVLKQVVAWCKCLNENKEQKFSNILQPMTKAEIVTKIAKNTGLDKAAVLTTVEQFMECVKESLANDECVYLRGFGSFIVKQRATKIARNISKNTAIVIPAHNIPSFKPAKTFMRQVSGDPNFADSEDED
jgi:DNA-binding protein HU-beta